MGSGGCIGLHWKERSEMRGEPLRKGGPAPPYAAPPLFAIGGKPGGRGGGGHPTPTRGDWTPSRTSLVGPPAGMVQPQPQ